MIDALLHTLPSMVVVLTAARFFEAKGVLWALTATAIVWPAREWIQNGPPHEWGHNAWPEALLPFFVCAFLIVVASLIVEYMED